LRQQVRTERKWISRLKKTAVSRLSKDESDKK
jgi:hypothetical protein